MADQLQEIVALKSELKERDAQRDASYDEYLPYIIGDTYRQARKQGYDRGAEGALQSIFKARPNDEDADFTAVINPLKPAVENKISYLSLPLTVSVIEPPDELVQAAQPQAAALPASGEGVGAGIATGATGTATTLAPTPPTPVEGSAAVDFADRMEQAIQSLLKLSNMNKRTRELAWCLCTMGGGVLYAWPDFRHKLPRIHVRPPQNFYPVAYDTDGSELQMALWIDYMSGREIKAKWGIEDYVGEPDVEVLQYIDEEKFCIILNDEQWAVTPIQNKMGVVPIVCVGNMGVPGNIFGDFEWKDAIPVVREMNYQMYLMDKQSAALTNPTLFIRNPQDVSEYVAIGEGGVITAGQQGEVELLGPLNLPSGFWNLSGTLQNWFDLISDNPMVLRGEGGGSIVTGKGFNAQLGPIAARMQGKLNIITSGWEKVIRYMLLMWHDFPGMQSKVKGSGKSGKLTYYIEAEPKEFEVDGEMWTEIGVSLSAQSFIDRQGNDVEIMQLYQNELISWDTAQDNLPFIDNKKRERVKIERDRAWKAEGMAMAQQAAASPMTANVDIGAQERTNYGLERGYMGETGAPPGPEAEGVSPMGADSQMGNMPPEGNGEDLVSVLTEFFASIPKLQGQVWFGGDPLLNPEAMSQPNWKVTVWVEVPADKGTITRAAEKVPEIYGHIEFIVGQPSPDEPSVPVGGETEVEAVEPGMQPMEGAPEDELPPEMMGAM